MAALFPMLSEGDLRALADDIRENGQHEPAVMFDGQILDGRNRIAACELAGVEPRIRTLPACPDPLAFVLSANLHRRHLTESQRSVLAARVKPMQAEQARARMMAGVRAGDPTPNLGEGVVKGESADQVAQMFNVGRGTVETAAKLLRQGVPELVTAVERGEVAVSAAAAVSTLPAEEQREVVAGGKDAIKAKAREIREAKPKREARPPEQHPLTEAIRTAPDAGALDAALTAAVRVPGLPESVIDANASAYQARKAELRAAQEPTPPAPPAPAPTPPPPAPVQPDLFETAPAAAPVVTVVPVEAAEVTRLREENARLKAEVDAYRAWAATVSQRAVALAPTLKGAANLDRIRRLVELAGSPSENEARSAAMLACRMIREQGVKLLSSDPSILDDIHETNRQMLETARRMGVVL
jgi:hypothetical protein